MPWGTLKEKLDENLRLHGLSTHLRQHQRLPDQVPRVLLGVAAVGVVRLRDREDDVVDGQLLGLRVRLVRVRRRHPRRLLRAPLPGPLRDAAVTHRCACRKQGSIIGAVFELEVCGTNYDRRESLRFLFWRERRTEQLGNPCNWSHVSLRIVGLNVKQQLFSKIRMANTKL